MTYEAILNTCASDDAGSYYTLTCNYSLEVQVAYEVNSLPGFVYCTARRMGIAGGGSVALQDTVGESSLTIPDLDVIALYQKSGDNPAPAEDGQYYTLTCWVGPVERDPNMAWASIACLHPDETDRDCPAPWLDLSQGH